MKAVFVVLVWAATSAFVGVALAGCTPTADASHAESEIRALTAKLEKSLSESKALADRVESLENANSMRDLMDDYGRVAYLTPGSDGYTVIEFDLGRITVSLADVKPYANGTQITLQFGNLTSASIRGAKAKLEWGRVKPNGIADNTTAKSREVSFAKELAPASWTRVKVVLDGVPPSEFGFVRIHDMTHTQISLTRAAS